MLTATIYTCFSDDFVLRLIKKVASKFYEMLTFVSTLRKMKLEQKGYMTMDFKRTALSVYGQ